MFYFAYVDANNVCQDVYAMPSDLSSVPGYIAITEEQFTTRSVVGKIYDPETQTWSAPPEWVCNATQVQYGEGNDSVKDKFDAVDEALEGKVDASALEGKADAADLHSHDNKTVLDGITADKVAAWDAGTSSGGTTVVSMTAAEILEKLSGVDGQNSGLDADLLDGHDATYFATATQLNGKANAEHSHEGYAAEAHTHEGYATADHTHEGYASANDLAGKADANHTHNGYVTAEQLSGKADANHSHNDYINATTYANGMSNKADVNHSHNEYAASGHNHSGTYAPYSHSHNGYAASGHSHSEYFEKTGGTISGETNFSGGLVKAKGVQAVFHSGSQLIYGSNNLPTRIAGNAISATKTITVDSDERLKENIKAVDADKMAEFIKKIDVKTFNYIGNDVECIGAIAQQVQAADPEIAKYLVSEAEDGFLSVKIADLVFPLISTVQKLAKEVEELKNK